MKNDYCRPLGDEELFAKLRKLVPAEGVQAPQRASHQVEEVKASLMLVRLTCSVKAPNGMFNVLERICNETQKKSDILSCEGLFAVKLEFTPMLDNGINEPEALKKDELCVVMSSTEPVSMQTLKEELLSNCTKPHEEHIVSDCVICILTGNQEKSFDDLLSSYATVKVLSRAEESLEKMATMIGDTNEMKELFKIIMEEDASCKYYFYKFFENAGYPALSVRLICSAAEDNYKPAVQFLGGYEKFVEEESRNS